MSDKNPLLTQLLHLLEEMQATDIKVIDVRKQTSITDYMIIASGRAGRHIRAVAEKLLEHMKKAGTPAISSAGFESSEWILIDFNDCIVHIMQPETRTFYNLEGLWEE